MDVVELKSTITKMKFSEKRHNSRSEPAKERLNKFYEITQSKQQREKRMKTNEQSQINVEHH